MQIKNKWEKLFDEFLDLTEFRLIKHKGNDVECDPWIWSIVDLQGANLGNIEGDRFSDAQGILDRMDIYINDYFIQDIEDLLEEKGIDITWDYDYQDYTKKDRVYENRIVGLETIIPTLYKYNKENYRIELWNGT